MAFFERENREKPDMLHVPVILILYVKIQLRQETLFIARLTRITWTRPAVAELHLETSSAWSGLVLAFDPTVKRRHLE